MGLARVLSRDHKPGESGNVTARLLDDVRELVTQQLLAGERIWLVHASAKVDVCASSKRSSSNTGGKHGRTIVGVDPHRGEVNTKVCLEPCIEGAARRPVVKRALHGTVLRIPRTRAPFETMQLKGHPSRLAPGRHHSVT
jgi:hypothetical protein